MKDWFTNLTGFSERSPEQVRDHIEIDGVYLHSRANSKSFECGRLEVLSLQDLRERAPSISNSGETLRVSEVIGDAKALHADVGNAGAMFQVASQFNLLEMVSPSVTPEQGIAIYENDPTQGPACAIACGAGTIYRNYFVELDGQIGQSASKQVNCLAAVGESLGNVRGRLWEMRNGYALPSQRGLSEVDEHLKRMSQAELDELRAKLLIGVQWNTQVTLDEPGNRGNPHLVTQAYCSALPVAYSGLPSTLWERFGRLILEAAYEATLAATALNTSKTANQSVYLTLLGGGAFGNDQAWILDAIRRACRLYANSDLDVKIVSHLTSSSAVRKLVEAINAEG